jgi:Uma2 family endonuclease
MGLAHRRMSYTDLQQMPEDGRRFELYDGELFEMSGPILLHQAIANNLKRIIEDAQTTIGGISFIAPFDVVFSEFDVVMPDLIFLTQARRDLLDLRGPARAVPDLAIEVLSPSTRSNDRGRKMKMFARYGVNEYWIADPDTSVLEVWKLESGNYALTQRASNADVVRSPLLAPFAFPVSRAFQLP